MAPKLLVASDNYKQNNHLCLLLAYSMLLNLVLCGLYLKGINLVDVYEELSWTKKAAEEAEAVASKPCSGHGKAFLDGLVVDEDNGKPVCECYACFSGPDCSLLSSPCVADADSGNPIFMEPFWTKQKESSGVLVSGWHRLGYRYPDKTFMSKELEKYIHKVHELVGNAVTQEHYIIFGTGSTQLINAAVHALSSLSTNSNSSSSSKLPAFVVASTPFYPLYKSQTDYFKSENYEFKGDASLWKNTAVSWDQVFIEFVTSPNNPDGQLKKAVLEGSSVKTIHDCAYYWPHFTAIPAAVDEDIMFFSLSKLTGHAGTRFGWALIKDEDVRQKMEEYVRLNTLGVSHDTQLRVLKLLKAIVDKGGREIFEFGYTTMSGRWETLRAALSATSRFSLQHIPPHFCTFYQRIRGPSPAYAWLKCERKEDEDCYAVLNAAGILGRKGQLYGVENRYVRLSLIKSQDDFDLLLHKIQMLVSSESKNHPTL